MFAAACRRSRRFFWFSLCFLVLAVVVFAGCRWWINRFNSLSDSTKTSRRAPQTVWCRSGYEPSHCFLLDKRGVVLAKAPHFAPAFFFVFWSQHEARIGEPVWPEDFFSSLATLPEKTHQVIANSPLSDYQERRLIETAAGDWRLEFTKTDPQLTASDDFLTIIFSRPDKWKQELANLTTALNSTAFLEDWLARPAALQYLDLRFEEKVFYKFWPKAGTMDQNKVDENLSLD